ncbi:acetyltransferase [Aspergillus uvarum CBS 121591]|uniref:Acetyltransferase n=1 Tax=Aspergillus uvarum CBS 121591 TaxID=1448315 RepID=A0A319C8L2_9EURO|nr:acetyltransferase [Aspergillus uvarum CBS 121591]PYH81755.1 acetyltransferase [Aspergillus uvarum CBS 121591]
MTTVASASVMHDHETEKESKAENSPSRFTAVNGKDSLGSGTATPVTGTSRISARENPTLENFVSDRTPKNGAHAPSRHDESTRNPGYAERDNTECDQDDQRSCRSLSSAEHLGRSKRKRSESREEQEEHSISHKVPRSPDSRPDDSIASSSQPSPPNGVVTSQGESDVKQTPTHSRLDENGDIRTTSTNTAWNEMDSQLIKQAQRAQHLDATDAQLAEALQREANGHESPKGWSTSNRPPESSVQSEQSASMPMISQERVHPAVQVAPKRKRVFSNRTKTGCMTCRRRKKKCDEQHPACNNCIRGGFLCEGYSSRSTWQKPSPSKPPVPLQSKEGYNEISSQYMHDINQLHERPQALTEHIETSKMRPIVVEDADRSASQFSTSPTGVNSGRGWTKRTWGGSNHPAYIPDHLTKSDYRDVPSIHELSREGHSKSDYAIVPPIRELSHGNHPKSNASLFQSGVDQRPAHSNNLDTSSPQAQARMALSIEHQLSARTVSGDETEKEKMMRGELYRPYDVQLVEERDRCKAALWRFNNACNPVSGLSTKEQMRLLREVFVPPVSASNSPSGAPTSRSSGTIGQGAIVEAPFHCHYGYNVHLGEDVMISEDCLFVDDCPITIGAHTWIGPRVTIISSTAHANMQERKGSQSRYQGRSVAIEEDCYVGAGCTIYPGVRLRRGAYVAPGEVVKSDIVAYGFQGLKPGYM